MQWTRKMWREEGRHPLLQEGRPLSGDRAEGVGVVLGPSPHHPRCAAEAVAGLAGLEQGPGYRSPANQGAPDRGRSGSGSVRA